MIDIYKFEAPVNFAVVSFVFSVIIFLSVLFNILKLHT